MNKMIAMVKLMSMLYLLLSGLYVHAQDKEIEAKTSKALLCYVDKDYEKAAQLYEELLEKDYKNTYLLTQCGLSYYHQQKYEQAREKMRLATLYGDVNDKPKMAMYYSNLSAAYSHLNDDEKAFENAVKGYYMDNTSQSRLWNAASMAQNLSRYDNCLKLMDDAEIGALHYAFETLYARSYYGQQNFEDAVRHYVVFFDRYDQRDDFVPLIINDERNNFLNASLYLLSATNDTDKQDQIVHQVVQVQRLHPMVMFRQDMLDAFTRADNYCTKHKLDCTMCNKVFRAWVKDPNIYDEIRFNFYALRNYADTYQLSTNYLENKDLGDSEVEVKQLQFLSALHLYLAAYKKRGAVEKTGETMKLLAYFDGLFAGKTTHSDEEFMAIPGIKVLLVNMLDVFRTSFPSVEEQKLVVPLLKKFVARIPNDTIKNKTLEMMQQEDVDQESTHYEERNNK